MKYEFAGPNVPDNIRPDIVVQELSRIHEEHDGIRPADVVDEARPKDSPLHSAFEWNNKLAADQHRLTQARQLIRAVISIPEPERGETFTPLRAFVSVHTEGTKRVYRPIHIALANPEEREALLRRMRREWSAMKVRYEALLEFSKIAEAVEGMDDALAS